MVFSLLTAIFRLNFGWLSETLALLSSHGRGRLTGMVCCLRPATAQLIVRQRGVASELTQAIPAAVATTSLAERTQTRMAAHLPPGDSLSTTLSSPQFAQALTMFWSALQSGQAGPVVRQFGLGPEAVSAAASGNIEEFVNALEAEAKAQPQQQTEEKAPGPQESGTDKKDDDDEGMALD